VAVKRAKIFEGVPDEVHDRLVALLGEARQAHPGYRDDELLLRMLCEVMSDPVVRLREDVIARAKASRSLGDSPWYGAQKTTTRTTRTVKDLIEAGEDAPLPLSVIPNYMGINLCSVDSLSWTRREDGQLVNLTINFIPAEKS
jgi:hypothetical protein